MQIHFPQLVGFQNYYRHNPSMFRFLRSRQNKKLWLSHCHSLFSLEVESGNRRKMLLQMHCVHKLSLMTIPTFLPMGDNLKILLIFLVTALSVRAHSSFVNIQTHTLPIFSPLWYQLDTSILSINKIFYRVLSFLSLVLRYVYISAITISHWTSSSFLSFNVGEWLISWWSANSKTSFHMTL